MRGYNRVILAGNLTRDPELRNTPKGLAVAKLGMAISRSWKDQQSGEMREEVTFVDVDAFGKQAELIGQFLRKGSALLVEGRLKLDTWEDKASGQKRSKLGVVLENVTFLDGKGGGKGGEAKAEAVAALTPIPVDAAVKSPIDDEDVPF